MKFKAFVLAAFLSISLFSFSNPTGYDQDKPEIGDTFIISKHKGEAYKHIDFPHLNFIVKRGGFASYNSVYNLEVVVTAIKENKEGGIIITLERKDGKKFFNQMQTVKSNYSKALASDELKVKS